jgi:hypothetical protein
MRTLTDAIAELVARRRIGICSIMAGVYKRTGVHVQIDLDVDCAAARRLVAYCGAIAAVITTALILLPICDRTRRP